MIFCLAALLPRATLCQALRLGVWKPAPYWMWTLEHCQGMLQPRQLWLLARGLWLYCWVPLPFLPPSVGSGCQQASCLCQGGENGFPWRGRVLQTGLQRRWRPRECCDGICALHNCCSTLHESPGNIRSFVTRQIHPFLIPYFTWPYLLNQSKDLKLNKI